MTGLFFQSLAEERCAAVVQLTSAILICIHAADCRPVCRFEDIQNPSGTVGAYDVKGCEKLDFVDQMIHDEGAAELSRTLHGDVMITDLYLTNTGLTAEGARSISNVLEHTNLRGLYLWRNKIGDEGVKYVVDAIANNPTIETLYLGYTDMTDEGAILLAKMLKNNNKLVTLDLRGNKIKDAGAEALAEALHHNTKLSTIFLWNNNIGPAGLKHIHQALIKNEHVHTLHAHDNDAEAHHLEPIAAEISKNRETMEREGRLPDEL